MSAYLNYITRQRPPKWAYRILVYLLVGSTTVFMVLLYAI